MRVAALNKSAFTLSIANLLLSRKKNAEMSNACNTTDAKAERPKERYDYGIESQWKVINFINGFCSIGIVLPSLQRMHIDWLVLSENSLCANASNAITSLCSAAIAQISQAHTLPLPFRCMHILHFDVPPERQMWARWILTDRNINRMLCFCVNSFQSLSLHLFCTPRCASRHGQRNYSNIKNNPHRATRCTCAFENESPTLWRQANICSAMQLRLIFDKVQMNLISHRWP